MVKKCAIVGTAPSWVKAPWEDPSVEIWCLNDGYMCRDAQGQGVRRASRWYDLHPIDKMWFRPTAQRTVRADEIPKGHYIRPEGHLAWLKTQAMSIPVYLQDEPPADWPANARRFPVEAVIARFGEYWASGPSYMLAQALIEGFTEIQIFGIHLSTQTEYLEQRPNFEHLLGIAKGMGVTVTMAEESPLLKHGWKYGYEPKPEPVVPAALTEARAEIKTVRKEKAEMIGQLVAWPRFRSKAKAMARFEYLELVESDLAQQIARHHAGTAVIALGG
jgi:hypothetical protein